MRKTACQAQTFTNVKSSGRSNTRSEGCSHHNHPPVSNEGVMLKDIGAPTPKLQRNGGAGRDRSRRSIARVAALRVSAAAPNVDAARRYAAIALPAIALLLAQATGEERGLGDRRRRRRLRRREHRVELGDRRRDPLPRRQHARVVQPRDAVVRIERDRLLEARQHRRRGVGGERAPRLEAEPMGAAFRLGRRPLQHAPRRVAEPQRIVARGRRRPPGAAAPRPRRAGRGDRATRPRASAMRLVMPQGRSGADARSRVSSASARSVSPSASSAVA